MVLRIIGSSSAGNGYVLRTRSGHSLLLEAGVPGAAVRAALDHDILHVDGCIVSHSHGDHAGRVRDILADGIRCYALPETLQELGLDEHPFCAALTPQRQTAIGGWTVMPLPVLHDVPCAAYVIAHHEMGRLLFATDTPALGYRIPRLDHILIEANYSDECLTEAIEAGQTEAAMRGRLLSSHMELGTAIRWLQGCDLSRVREVVLIHLSPDNADPAAFVETVTRATGVPTYAAAPGMELDLTL